MTGCSGKRETQPGAGRNGAAPFRVSVVKFQQQRVWQTEKGQIAKLNEPGPLIVG